MLAQNAPDFEVTLSSGEEKSLYTDYLNNGKTVVLKLFFTTCPPCNSISPLVEALYQDWGAGAEDVEFISLAIFSFDDNIDVAAYKENLNLSWPGVGSDGGSVTAAEAYTSENPWGTFQSTPTFIVISPNGNVFWNPAGSQSAMIASLDEAIEATGALRPNYTVAFSGNITNVDGDQISDVNLIVSNGDLVNTENGFEITNVPIGESLTITPKKNTGLLNGVTTFDLVLITKHLLELEPFTNDYQYIAADANSSGTVTTFDIVVLKRLILNIDQSLPNGLNSWVFDPPFISINDIEAGMIDINFTGIKIGDINIFN